MTNREAFEHLVTDGGIRIKRSALFDSAPKGMPPCFDWDKVEGMMLGLAIGKLLGQRIRGLPA